MLRSVGAVCGAILLLGLLWTLLLAPQQVVVGDAEGPEATTDLQIDKIGPDTALADSVITYTLLVTNNAAVPLNGVIITDTWNSQLYSGTYTTSGAVVVDSLVYVTQPTKYAQFSLAPLPANSNGSIQFTMTITPGLQPRYTAQPTVLGNSAVITTSTPGVSANTDSVNTLIVGPILQITKTVTPTSARPGQVLTYTFRLDNRARSDAIDGTNVVISERLPSNVLFESGLSTWHCDVLSHDEYRPVATGSITAGQHVGLRDFHGAHHADDAVWQHLQSQSELRRVRRWLAFGQCLYHGRHRPGE